MFRIFKNNTSEEENLQPRNGYARWQNQNGTVFEGEWLDGRPYGKACLLCPTARARKGALKKICMSATKMIRK